MCRPYAITSSLAAPEPVRLTCAGYVLPPQTNPSSTPPPAKESCHSRATFENTHCRTDCPASDTYTSRNSNHPSARACRVYDSLETRTSCLALNVHLVVTLGARGEDAL